jgi:hypothetical protein
MWDGVQPGKLAGVDGERRSIWLELRFEGGSPSGHAVAGSGATRGFAGWLGLMAAVEALAGEDAPTPANRQEEGDHDR